MAMDIGGPGWNNIWMPRGTLNFKLPEEQEEFEIAQRGGAYRAALWELNEWLFFRLGKHEWPADYDQRTVEKIKEKFREATADLDI
jgi:hypothetical protein